MAVYQVVGREGLTQFKFYTYDPLGRDIVIAVWAKTRAEAVCKFNNVYGADLMVDAIIQGETVAD